jgi:hypothetical protein
MSLLSTQAVLSNPEAHFSPGIISAHENRSNNEERGDHPRQPS